METTKKTRPTRDRYFMDMASLVATRGTCDRKQVGCVVVYDGHVIATGYNGSIAGMPHCDDVGHDMVDNHCIRTVHAELNAITQAARNGHRTLGSTFYITATPCWGCFKAMVNAGVETIIYGENYRIDERVLAAANVLGVKIYRLREDNVFETPRSNGVRLVGWGFYHGSVYGVREGASGDRPDDHVRTSYVVKTEGRVVTTYNGTRYELIGDPWQGFALNLPEGVVYDNDNPLEKLVAAFHEERRTRKPEFYEADGTPKVRVRGSEKESVTSDDAVDDATGLLDPPDLERSAQYGGGRLPSRRLLYRG